MYTQFYGFSEKPFELTPDPKFLYLSPSHREALASMIYGINERRGFISITGEVGTGKTTLIYTLLSNLSEKVKPIFIYHTTITFEEFLAKILLDLKVSLHEEDKTSLLLKLSDYLRMKMALEETLAIIIDEGQNLPQETLEEFRMLSNVETSKTKLLQSLLVGQPELEEKLNSKELRQLKQRIGLRRSLQPLNPQECREYIEHRLNLVGSSASKVLTADAIGLIVHYSKGIPRTINILCDNAFLIGYSFSQKKIDEKIIKEVIEDMENQFIPTDHEEKEYPHKEVIKKVNFILETTVELDDQCFSEYENDDDMSEEEVRLEIMDKIAEGKFNIVSKELI
jgi:general secretion pathway protein A